MKTTDKAIIEKLKDRITESKTVMQSILSDLPDGSLGKILVENEIKYISSLESEIASLEAQDKEPSDKKEYPPCPHPEKYRFIDKEGYERCASCHGYIDFATGGRIIAPKG